VCASPTYNSATSAPLDSAGVDHIKGNRDGFVQIPGLRHNREVAVDKGRVGEPISERKLRLTPALS